MLSLENQFEAIERFIEKQGNLADLNCKINCSKANLERELRGQKCKMLRGKILHYCRYTPPHKDANGSIKETRSEANTRMENNKRMKTFEDHIKSVDSKIAQEGAEVKLKAILYKYGITQKFGGGFEGNACQIIMKNEKLHLDIIDISDSLVLKNILEIIKGYRFLNAVMSTSDFSEKHLATLSKNYSLEFENFETLVNVLTGGKICKVKFLILDLIIICTLSSTMLHKSYGKDINIHSSSGIERSHERMKMDIRRQLGSRSWAKTLLTRWLMRTDRGSL